MTLECRRVEQRVGSCAAQICLACLSTISAAVLLHPLASITHLGSTRWTSEIGDAFGTRRMAPLRFSHYGDDRGSAIELEPLTGEPSTNAGCLAEPETDSD
nr:uncharacterized protein LOC129383295 [Dermacentor andersoni]